MDLINIAQLQQDVSQVIVLTCFAGVSAGCLSVVMMVVAACMKGGK